jgi:hypothetical protein
MVSEHNRSSSAPVAAGRYWGKKLKQKEASAGDKRGGSIQRLPSAPRVGAV